MARNDYSQHSDGEELNLTDEQRSALDRTTEILDDLQPDRTRVFERYLKELIDGEEGRESKNDSGDNAGRDH